MITGHDPFEGVKGVLVHRLFQQVKLEMEGKFPGDLGLHHEQPRAESVILFYDLLKKCASEVDLEK